MANTVSSLKRARQTITKTAINRANKSYAGRMPPAAIVLTLLSSSGKAGPGIDYLLHTVNALREHGIEDSHMQELCAMARALSVPD